MCRKLSIISKILRMIVLLCIIYYIISHILISILMLTKTNKLSSSNLQHTIIITNNRNNGWFWDYNNMTHNNNRTSITTTTVISEKQQQQQKRSNNNSINNYQSRSRNVLFVHIGKTGGETFKNIIKIGCDVKKNHKKQTECYQNLPNTSTLSLLSNSIISYYHCFEIQSSLSSLSIHSINNNNISYHIDNNNITTFLFTIRHPFDRIQSWYHYVNPRYCHNPNNTMKKKKTTPSCRSWKQSNENPNSIIKQFFYNCFPTFDQWIMSSIQPILIQIQQRQHVMLQEQQQQQCNDDHHSLLCFISLFIRNNNNNNKQNNISSWLLSSSSLTNHKIHDANDDDQRCIKLASQVLTGHNIDIRKEEFFAHMVANYHEYVSHTIYQSPNIEVMIIRMESLWGDIKHIDQTFFYNNSNITTTNPFIDYGKWDGYQYTHDTEPYHSWTNNILTIIRDNEKQRLQTSSTGLNRYHYDDIDDNNLKHIVITKLLCCTILNELKLYQELINRAVNLNTEMKESTLHSDAMKCGFSSWQILIIECQELLDTYNMM